MRQVLIWLGPVPIFGFGTMLFVSFVVCYWLIGKRADREGVPRQPLYDLVVWIILAGLLGARLVFMIQYQVPWWEFYRIWEGGLVFYGSALGGVIGYGLAHYFLVRRHGLDSWQVADILAPAIALGLGIGRFGCLLNGCCYGHVACPSCWSIHFPLSAPPRFSLTAWGYQTAAGFTLADDDPRGRTVGAVEPDSAAALEGGLRPGDEIVAADRHVIRHYDDLWQCLVRDWPRGKNDLQLTVNRGGQTFQLPPFTPRTIGLHPTQLYESISAFLLFFLLLAYEPFRRRPGELTVLLMLGYAAHRFVNESLRNDTNKVLGTGLTLSQNGSILLFLAGLILLALLLRRGEKPTATLRAEAQDSL